jgi:hypothetical protein
VSAPVVSRASAAPAVPAAPVDFSTRPGPAATPGPAARPSLAARAALTCVALAAAALACVALAAPARARADWLVAYAAAEAAAARGGDTDAAAGPALLYPAPGLPAVVAGEPGRRELVAIVRLVVPITPPPGAQRDRALAGWRASLRGEGPALRAEGGPAPLHQHGLRVAEVRPLDGRTRLYRLRLPVPAYVAPHTYTLAVVVPGGRTLRADAAVRVVDGATPRVAWLAPSRATSASEPSTPDAPTPSASTPDAPTPDASPPLGPSGVDVAVVSATRGGALPATVAGGPVVLDRARLRGVRLAVRLPDAPTAGAPERAPRTPDEPSGPPEAAAPPEYSADGAAPAGPTAPCAPTLDTPDPSTLVVDHRACAAATALTVVAPLGHALEVSGAARVTPHPGYTLGAPAGPPSAAYRVAVAPGALARLRVGPRAPALPVRLPVPEAPAAAPVRLALEGLPSGPGGEVSIAWFLGEDRTAFGPSPSVTHAFRADDAVAVEALAIAADGRAGHARALPRISAAGQGCATVAAPRADPPGAGAGFGGRLLALVAAWTIARRRGNARRPRARSSPAPRRSPAPWLP